MNNHNTTAFPATAAKPGEENHGDRTMDVALLRCSSKCIMFITLVKENQESN